jgi:hypothetical protein
MSDPGYPAARLVAPAIQAHFATHLATHHGGVIRAPVTEDIEALIDAAFWASLRREEGYVPRISLALVPPDAVVGPLIFQNSLPLDAAALTKVAPAVERPGIHLGVWRTNGSLRVWGTVRDIPDSCPVFEVAAPGLLVVKHHRADGAKFVNVAVLEGDRIKIIDEQASAIPDCPPLVTSLLGLDVAGSWGAVVNVLVDLAVSMRAHGRGGILLVVPSGSDEWTDSIVKPIAYAVDPPYRALADLLLRPLEDRAGREWQEELEDTVQAVAGLTAVDGAAVVNDRCELLAFGAKIARRKGSPQVEEASVTEPIQGGERIVMHPSGLGGTRHLSAAQFVHDQRGAIALVASQDGRFTIFAWSPCAGRVHAHRVEALLL